jgi:CRP-like cAMP-binding protein
LRSADVRTTPVTRVGRVNPKPDRHALIRTVPLFAGCTAEELDEIDRLADEVNVAAGRTVITQGDLGQEFAVIIEGTAAIVKDGVEVATLGPGDYFGEVALLESITRTASVVARTDLLLEVVDRRGFNTLLDDLPRLSRSLLSGLAHRLADLEAENEHLRAAAVAEERS